MQHSKALIPLLFLWWTTALLSGMGCSIDREIGGFPDLDAGVAWTSSESRWSGRPSTWMATGFVYRRPKMYCTGSGETVENIVWTDPG